MNFTPDFFEMVDTRSNMQLDDLNYKPHGGKGFQNLIDRAIGARLYPPPWISALSYYLYGLV